MKKYKVSVVGASGYAGAELVRLLICHPSVELAALSSVSYTGKSISELYPSYSGICDMLLVGEEDAVEAGDVIFASLPHGLSQEIAKKCSDNNKLFIDLGADFRLYEAETYTEWYGKEVIYPDLHKKAVYGLSELYRDEIKSARIIGNPGCYPTSVAFALWPALNKSLVSTENIIIDAKSGATGAGKSLTQKTHFPECNEAFSPYNIGKHRHTPEIEQTLSSFAGVPVKVTFVPHLLPINRGIISTVYAKKNTDMTLEQIHGIYNEAYAGERFIRVLPLNETANLKNVRMSNFCDISLHEDAHTGQLIIVSAIDNMVKGAAGQAIQNMNIALGLDETAGIALVPPAI